MIPLTLAEVATAVDGELIRADPDAVVGGPVVVDSRLVEPGALFVALPGERSDGHDHAAAAVATGAVAVLATRPVDAPAVRVADGRQALGRLARAVRDRRPDLPVVGITGSQGKTTTKDLLAQVLAPLSPAGSTVVPPGSFNNEVGLPLTVLRIDESTRVLVTEMGARGGGHVAYLCSIARPTVGVVLCVGTAHLSEFGSRAAIADAKGELPEALPLDGTAVLNADDPLVLGMAARTQARVVTFGSGPHADVWAEDVRLDARARPSFVLRASGPHGSESAPVRMARVGAHQVPNALAAAAAAGALGVSVEQVATGLGAAGTSSRWRMEVTDRPDGTTVVNDAYNANPESVRAALEALVVLGRGRRTWAVLGEMRELGPTAADEHAGVGRVAASLGVDRVVAVGAAAGPIRDGAAAAGRPGRPEAVVVPDAAAAAALLREEVAPGDAVLVKASRAAGLEVVAEALLDGAARAGDPA